MNARALHRHQNSGGNDGHYRFPDLSGSRSGNAGRRSKRSRTGQQLADSGAEYWPVRFGVNSLLAVSAIDSQGFGETAGG
jgi:hypothetical protein